MHLASKTKHTHKKNRKRHEEQDPTVTLLKMGLDRKHVRGEPGGWERGRISKPLSDSDT